MHSKQLFEQFGELFPCLHLAIFYIEHCRPWRHSYLPVHFFKADHCFGPLNSVTGFGGDYLS